ncbi:MAG: hypothetical protein WCT20_04780, partial [Candidatus Babeliales bacterium]
MMCLMKPLLNAVLVGCFLVAYASADNRTVVDKIVARVDGVNILQSDLAQPRITTDNGRPFTLDEAIMEELMVAHAANQHLMPSTLDVDRQIASFKIQNKLQYMTDKEFEAQIKEGGLTLKMYKQQIGRRIAVENVKRAEIYEKVLVSSQEVEAYYKQHPEYAKESYQLEICIINKDECVDTSTIPVSKWEKLDWI